jgi:ABC-type multidrug transport system fused ATPase/permease subunit
MAMFENGSIVQEGSHEELIVHTDRQYYELYMAQAHHYIEK